MVHLVLRDGDGEKRKYNFKSVVCEILYNFTRIEK